MNYDEINTGNFSESSRWQIESALSDEPRSVGERLKHVDKLREYARLHPEAAKMAIYEVMDERLLANPELRVAIRHWEAGELTEITHEVA